MLYISKYFCIFPNAFIIIVGAFIIIVNFIIVNFIIILANRRLYYHSEY